MSSIAGNYTYCGFRTNTSNIEVFEIRGNSSSPQGSIAFDGQEFGRSNECVGGCRVVGLVLPISSGCDKQFYVERRGVSGSYAIYCKKLNCISPTTQSPTTQPPTTLSTTHIPTTFTTTETSPTTFTVDTMAPTSATSSASRDVGIIGRAVSYVKDNLSWINRLGTGGRPSQDIVTKDFTYSMQSKEVRSRISRDVWLRCVDDANENYNRGLGYITPVEIFNRKPPQFWRS